jgi:hypothetical protein
MRTAVNLPEEPTRRAMVVAGLVVTGVGIWSIWAPPGLRRPIRMAARLAGPALVKPLAVFLTSLGL